MSSRESILQAIRSIPRVEKNLPDAPNFKLQGELGFLFTKALEANKAEVMDRTQFEKWMETNQFARIFSYSEEFQKYSSVILPEDPHDLENLQLAILEGQFGVAENGAIWLEDQELPHRAIPFITEHLVIVLNKTNLVDTMHQAYQQIGANHSGFGVFIAGPSKTADIEQSLVIGAHGAKSLRVVMI